MSILLCVTDRDVSSVREIISRRLPAEVDVWVYPDMPSPVDVEMAVLWKHPAGLLSALPNLRLVHSFGAGVEHLLGDAGLPSGVRIARIVDEALTVSMRNYVLTCVLVIHKQFRVYHDNQRRRHWRKPDPVELPLRVGVLGLGALGGDIAAAIAALGFDTLGYSRSPKRIGGVRSFAETDLSLYEFVAQVNTLLCLLPRTPSTEGILDYELFRRLPPGSALINVARGAHLVESDLLRALDEGFLREAYLDVFQEEPLPAAHPFWGRPEILVTPHVASVTNPGNAARIIAENYLRLKNGEALLYEVDREKGY